MNYYYSPFPISEETIKKLNLSGLKRIYNEHSITNEDTYLLYNRPDLILEDSISINQGKKITLEEIISSYESLLKIKSKTNNHLIAIWQINFIPSDILSNNAKTTNHNLSKNIRNTPEVNLINGIIVSNLKNNSNIIELYLDLELQGLLFGRDADFDYQDKISSFEKDSDSIISYFLNHAVQNKTLKSDLKDLKKKNHNYEILLKELDQLKISLELKEREIRNQLKSYQDLNNEQYLQLCNAKKLFSKILLISKKINSPVNTLSEIYFDKFSQKHNLSNGTSLQVQALLSAYSYNLDRAKKILKGFKK